MSLPDGAWKGIWHLYLAAVFVGGLWQVETDFACFLANTNAGFIYVNASYTWGTIIMNFLVYFIFHSFFFYISTRGLKAEWAEVTIDFQVGWGGFGFYIAGNYAATSGYFARSCNAGLWTTFYSIFPGIFSIIWYYYGGNTHQNQYQNQAEIEFR